MTEAKPSLKRTLIGKVVSAKRAKTVTVLVERLHDYRERPYSPSPETAVTRDETGPAFFEACPRYDTIDWPT